MRNRPTQNRFPFMASMPSATEKRSEERRAYFRGFNKPLLAFPEGPSEHDRDLCRLVRDDIVSLFGKDIDRLTFSEMFKGREKVANKLKMRGFMADYDIENRQVKIKKAPKITRASITKITGGISE